MSRRLLEWGWLNIDYLLYAGHLWLLSALGSMIYLALGSITV